MAETVTVVVDAMGGDNAPREPVKAAVEAVKERSDIKVLLTGREEIIKKEVFNILSSIKNGIFDNNDKLSDSIKAAHSKHFSPMTSLRDTEEQIEVAIVER